jgi:hypothetical protein
MLRHGTERPVVHGGRVHKRLKQLHAALGLLADESPPVERELSRSEAA